MRSLQGAWLFLVFYVLSSTNSENIGVQGKCLADQRALLLQLNHSLPSLTSCDFLEGYYCSSWRKFSSKRSSWHQNTDCCSSWDGITCDRDGHVISLDLSSEFIMGGLDNPSSLFKLQYIERLNLADNPFGSGSLGSPIPSGFRHLSNLKYLNLSYSAFGGEIPIEISRMKKLVTLDLSTLGLSTTTSFKLTDLDLETLTRNLTELRVLFLDGIDLSAHGNKWCRTLSSSLPKLQVLSLVECGISGPFDPSLVKLRSLSVLRLDSNSMFAKVPEFFNEFHNLTFLSLSECELYGKFPERLLQLQKLRSLVLSNNNRLQGSLPEFSKDSQLRELDLSSTSFTGELPNSVGNLKFLSRFCLNNCRFNGSIPSSFSKLSQLQDLELSENSFTGLITSIISSNNLKTINLSHNRLTGPIPFQWNKLLKLTDLDLSNNILSGTISMGLLTLPSLCKLNLSLNNFTGQLGEFSNGSSSLLEVLDLSNNRLQGHIPLSIFEMSKLQTLSLSSNNFSGTINPISPRTLQTLPQSQLTKLDLSNNQVHGKIPNWIWKIGNGSLHELNLSLNFLEDPDQPWPVNSFELITLIDLHSNRLRGNNLIVPSYANFLDYSFNNFTTVIPSSCLSVIELLDYSNNQLNGDITWICEAAVSMVLLDLSYNNFSGQIPSCLGSKGWLQILNLRGNNFQGNISEELFPQPQFCDLKTLDLGRNNLEGYLPRSIVNCRGLEVLEVGNNQLTGTFPSWLGNMPQLRVLVLRSNKFYGAWRNQGSECNFSMLQIIDISSNNFSGVLPGECFLRWNAMVANKDERVWNHKDQKIEYAPLYSDMYYQPTVTVIVKGVRIDLVKILTIFTTIDLSNNNFKGEIPEIIGSLTSLCNVNLSNNAFTGKISPTFGNLTHLESLDLSQNKLIGEIPFQLAGLSSLEVLNVSFNKLVGRIPSGGQFQTFNTSSFQGNVGLCGFPVSKNCTRIAESPPNGSNTDDENASETKDEFDWVLFVVTFMGFVVGAGMVIGPQYFWTKGRQWVNERINKILNIS